MYLTGSVTGASERLDAGEVGFLKTPNVTNLLREGWVWAADNGCYSPNYVGDELWLEWLDGFSREERSRCLFATAPDVVGDAGLSLPRSLPWLPVIRSLGYPAALVAQDGLAAAETPWDEFDVLFIGGTTRWKLGADVKALIRAAKDRGKRVHVGRVNSQGRYLAFAALGCESADGTFLAFGPEKNLPILLGWLRHHRTQTALSLEEDS